MSDPEADPEAVPEEDGTPARTPFDNPWFLPVIVSGLTLWFGYDGWFNEKIEAVMFNRYGAVFLFGLAVYWTLDEVYRTPFNFPALLTGYALWLGYVGFLSSADSWFRGWDFDVTATRYAAGVFLALAALSSARRLLFLRRQPTPP